MATIVPRQGPELDQDERVGLLAAQPYDKMGFLGGFGQNPPKWGGIPPKWPFWGVSPPSRGEVPGGPKWPFWGSRGGPKWPFWALPPLIKDRFSRF